MSDNAHAPAAAGHAAHDAHPDSFYIKIWGVLLVLLVVSVIGPELGKDRGEAFPDIARAVLHRHDDAVDGRSHGNCSRKAPRWMGMAAGSVPVSTANNGAMPPMDSSLRVVAAA